MKDYESKCIEVLILADEISRRAGEFYQEDLDEMDEATVYACRVLTESGFEYDVDTGIWTREV